MEWFIHVTGRNECRDSFKFRQFLQKSLLGQNKKISKGRLLWRPQILLFQLDAVLEHCAFLWNFPLALALAWVQ